VSACLLGTPCTHDAGHNLSEPVVALASRYHLIPVCPEVAGGLPTPRPAAEIQPDGRVVTEDDADLTAAYERGAAHAVALAVRAGATAAVLKARSPSCGGKEVYDGTFSRTRRPGAGVTAQRLAAAGLVVVDEDDVTEGGVGAGHLPAG
jgi:uncharacterized protein YbbK (DUF523 family)